MRLDLTSVLPHCLAQSFHKLARWLKIPWVLGCTGIEETPLGLVR